MATTGTSEPAANFMKAFSHGRFIRPSDNEVMVGIGKENAPPFNNSDIQLCKKIIPLLGQLQIEAGKIKPLSQCNSNSSLAGEDIDGRDVSADQDSNEEECGDEVPGLVPAGQLSRSPKRPVFFKMGDKAICLTKGHRRRASEPVIILADNSKEEAVQASIAPTTSKDDSEDAPTTPLCVIEALKHEAAIRSQVKMKRMKHLDYRRGSMPVLPSATQTMTSKQVQNDRVHQIMRNFYGPKTWKEHHASLRDTAKHAHPPPLLLAGSPPKHSGITPPVTTVIPAAPPPPEILPSACLADQNPTSVRMPSSVALADTPKPNLAEVVSSLNIHPEPKHDMLTEVRLPQRKSSVSQDLDETFKRFSGNSDFSDSGSYASSDDMGGGSNWFSGFVGFRPPPAPKPRDGKSSAQVRKKVKKREMNAFAPAGF